MHVRHGSEGQGHKGGAMQPGPRGCPTRGLLSPPNQRQVAKSGAPPVGSRRPSTRQSISQIELTTATSPACSLQQSAVGSGAAMRRSCLQCTAASSAIALSLGDWRQHSPPLQGARDHPMQYICPAPTCHNRVAHAGTPHLAATSFAESSLTSCATSTAPGTSFKPFVNCRRHAGAMSAC